MGGGGWDWQDRENRDEKEAKEAAYTAPTLNEFSDKELQKELKKRKLAQKTEETRMAALKAHNDPILKEIKTLQEQIDRLNKKLRL